MATKIKVVKVYDLTLKLYTRDGKKHSTETFSVAVPRTGTVNDATKKAKRYINQTYSFSKIVVSKTKLHDMGLC